MMATPLQMRTDRRDDGTIAMAGNYPQPGYAEEALDDATNAEIVAFFARAAIPPVPEFARSGDFFHGSLATTSST